MLGETRIQFKLGDDALRIEPMRPHSGAHPDDGDEEVLGVRESLEMFAEAIGVTYNQIRLYRQTASRWPVERRAEGVAFEVHRILEKLADRFERILDPPENPRGGEARWTCDTAKRLVGWQVDAPQTAQEKIEAIHDLAADEQVASRAVTDLLRRPEVAFHAAHDDETRHTFHRAWLGADEWPEDDSTDVPGRESTITPALRSIDKTLLFLDGKKAAHQLLIATHGLVPELQDEQLAEEAQVVIVQDLARLRAACDWIEHALATGEIDMDEELARLLDDGAVDDDRPYDEEDDEDDGGAGVPA
ncbi:DUF6192 family protein [Streptomyces niger]|uniref:DUF6192 family protein n=1 Tax=Streptomyces niger TaxID=66373 RepID=UPI00069A7E0A|nr:DUF6192 family protein [Streptomyces niger]